MHTCFSFSAYKVVEPETAGGKLKYWYVCAYSPHNPKYHMVLHKTKSENRAHQLVKTYERGNGYYQKIEKELLAEEQKELVKGSSWSTLEDAKKRLKIFNDIPDKNTVMEFC